jgi:hypothetical protein
LGGRPSAFSGQAGKALNLIWEEDFQGYPYGFRRRRSQKGSELVSGALDALPVGIVRKKVNWMLSCREAGLQADIFHTKAFIAPAPRRTRPQR